MTIAASPIRYPDTKSRPLMTRRGWWLVVLNLLMGYGVSSERELHALVARARSVEDVTDEQAQMQCAAFLAEAAARGELCSEARKAMQGAVLQGVSEAEATATGVGDEPPTQGR